MTRISIRDLHQSTGRWIREAARSGDVIVTERGRPIATIVPYLEAPARNRFKARRLRSGYARLLEKLGAGSDSAVLVAEDRDRT